MMVETQSYEDQDPVEELYGAGIYVGTGWYCFVTVTGPAP
jgi:hypothetical protein